MPLGRLVRQVADKAQVGTQRSWKRPYGVGLITAGADESGAHIFYNCPSGNYYDYKAFAMGARSQAAKTYLERNFGTFVVLVSITWLPMLSKRFILQYRTEI